MRFLIAFLILLLLPNSAIAQGASESDIPAIKEMLANPSNTNGSDTVPFGIILPAGFKPNEATDASVQAAVRGFYDYRTEAFQHRLGVFWWQQFSSQIIFFVVIIIVGVGLYFSWLQFHAAEDKSKIGTTTVEAGKVGFKVSSPILGVIILLVSLAFFYLYLVHVYPISDLY